MIQSLLRSISFSSVICEGLPPHFNRRNSPGNGSVVTPSTLLLPLHEHNDGQKPKTSWKLSKDRIVNHLIMTISDKIPVKNYGTKPKILIVHIFTNSFCNYWNLLEIFNIICHNQLIFIQKRSKATHFPWHRFRFSKTQK